MKEAWNRWGEKDEAGAVNAIEARQIVDAAGLVREGRAFCLAQPISSATAVPKHRPGIMHFMGRDGGDYAAGARRPGGFQFSEDTLVMPVHSGTHIDALCHCWYDDQLYNGFEGVAVRSSGATRCGIDKMPPIVTRGVLLDCAGVNGTELQDGTSIGLDLVRKAFDAARTEPLPGDAILIRTGWLERQSAGTAVDFNTEPGIDVEAAEFLAENGVSVIGADNFALEVLPFPNGTVFPVHQRLIRDYGIPILEGLVLGQLAEAGATTFLFFCSPLLIVGGTGSPVAPVAVL